MLAEERPLDRQRGHVELVEDLGDVGTDQRDPIVQGPLLWHPEHAALEVLRSK